MFFIGRRILYFLYLFPNKLRLENEQLAFPLFKARFVYIINTFDNYFLNIQCYFNFKWIVLFIVELNFLSFNYNILA